MAAAAVAAKPLFVLLLLGCFLVAWKTSFQQQQDDNADKEDERDNSRVLLRGPRIWNPTRQPNINFVLIRGEQETCYGTLIHADLVLTSAQCRPYLKANDTAFVGFPTLSNSIPIERLIPHPQFDFPYYDFMLIKLATPDQSTPPRFINFDAPIPATGDSLTLISPAERPMGFQPRDTQLTPLQTLGRAACQEGYQPPIITPLMICAGTNVANMTGRCSNDAGSPLFGTSGLLVGVLSTGNGGCGRNSAPAIFSRVSWAAEWIAETTCAVSSVPSVFCDSDTAATVSRGHEEADPLDTVDPPRESPQQISDYQRYNG